MSFDKNKILQAVDFLKQNGISHVDVIIVLGSGLSHIADLYEQTKEIPYNEIPYMSASKVSGHSSRLVFLKKDGKNIAFLQGRMHMYEGHSAFQSAFPIAVLGELGARSLIVTNAAGGLNPDFKPGDIMLIEDHIKTQTSSPLEGVLENQRFVDMQNAYDVSVFDNLNSKFQIKKGIYISTLGPQYETPAEVRYFQQMGGDAVGMSTVMETIMARFYNIRVIGFSMITNVASGLSDAALEHQDVVSQANSAGKTLGAIIEYLLTCKRTSL